MPGVPIENVECPTHDVAVDKPAAQQAVVHLRDKAVIPNKDFLLKYTVAGQRIDDAVLTHRGSKGGFFTLILQPPARVAPADMTPRELVFVLDTSGSMSGFPIEKAKEAMKLAHRRPAPAGHVQPDYVLGRYAHPVPGAGACHARTMSAKRRSFLRARSGSGGTEMMKAIRASLEGSDKAGHVRVVCFMTDGEVGNDMEIIAEVQQASERAGVRFRHRQFGESFPARQNGAVRPRRGGLRGAE